MPALPGVPRFDEISSRWLVFAEHRLAYYTELYRSGRWQRYYTRERFTLLMHDVIGAVKTWRKLAAQAPPAAGKTGLRPAA